MFDLTSDFGRVVKGHLEQQFVMRLTTIDSKGTPQPGPVWFLWQDDSFLIFSQLVIVFTGQAVIDRTVPLVDQIPAYIGKYKEGIAGPDMTPEEFSRESSVAIKIRPTEVRGWE